ncbi:MAG: pseudouridylate synthase [Prevotella sp.]|nr:pseudouridylate synthase [Prevotella sp.]MBR1505201.1 pseudouridylate synthase [Prevotella sp.]
MTDREIAPVPEEFLRSIDIHELLPQQEPFVMIDTLTFLDTTRTVTETTISEESIFTDNGRFSASGLIENIAQTCAARIGYVNKYILKKGIQIGFIGAIRDLHVFELPCVGQTIVTTINVQEEIFGMTLATADITCNGKTLVTTEIKIAIKEE